MEGIRSTGRSILSGGFMALIGRIDAQFFQICDTLFLFQVFSPDLNDI